MKIAWFQYDIKWKDSKSNLSKIKEAIQKSTKDFVLLVLPEMFDTGFVLNPVEIENRVQERVLREMQALSKEHSMSIIFSMIWQEKDQYTNRAFYISGDEIDFYDKIHLFKPGGEGEKYQAGTERKVIETNNGLSILPLICYDLRFPEVSRNKSNIDLIVYVASWPEARTKHWDILLKARAVENQCYVLGVNRVGKDGNNLHYIGHSQLINYTGEIVSSEQSDDFTNEGLFVADIDINKMHHFRKKLPFLKDIVIN